jgi:2-polyprenyl-6-methoxyphenol hydroxylase-like FAD-dependent oxidoreductase
MRGAVPSRTSYDAVVVGARCAGAATALQLARRGLRVLLADRGAPGTDTLSTHALMWGAVLQLQRLGVLETLLERGTPVVRTTTFHYADEAVRIPLKPRPAVPGLAAPRRYLLDAVLAEAAEAAGAARVYGARLVDLLREGSRVRGAILEDADGTRRAVAADVVVGADGLRGTVSRLVGAEPYRQGRHAAGVLFAYHAGLPNDGYHWHYRPGVSVGLIPTNDGLTCVFASVPAARFRDEIAHDTEAGYGRVLAECSPALLASVSRAERVSRLHGFAGQAGFLRQSWGEGWALVGDAAYFKDPITAHGITDALRDAELLAGAIADGSPAALAGYQETRDALATRLFELTDEIASFEWDLETLPGLHRALSDEMKREVAAQAELFAPPGTGAATPDVAALA